MTLIRQVAHSGYMAALLPLLCVEPAFAAPGNIDLTFGSGGTVTTAVAAGVASGRAVALEPDGRILVAGNAIGTTGTSAAVVRYLPGGLLDSSFDGDGKATVPLSASSASINAIAPQADGRILLAGMASNGTDGDFLLLRLRANGAPDLTFGSAGRVQTGIGASDEAINAIVIQPDGLIVAAGYSKGTGANRRIALARYRQDGTLDASFGNGGKVVTEVGTGNAAANAVAIDGAGRIVVAGSANNGRDDDFAVVRYLPNGTPDATFGVNGVVTGDRGTSDYHEVANAIVLQADGRILIAGGSAPARNTGGFEVGQDFTLRRYAADGSRDFSFGSSGVVVTQLAYYNDVINALTVQPDSAILALGTVDNAGGDPSYALVRYRPDGTEDTRFAAGGRLIDGLGYGNALALQPDGRIVAAGSVNAAFSVRRFLARDDNNDGLAEGWLLTPEAFSFTDVVDATPGSVQTSNLITVTGLESGVRVPAKVCGGEMAVNGNTYGTGLAWVQNGDRISVRHTAAGTPGTVTNTVLSIGGVPSASNPTLLLGGVVSDTFSSTTAGTPVASQPQGCQPVTPDTSDAATGATPTLPADGGTGATPAPGADGTGATGGGGGGRGGGAMSPLGLALLALAGWLDSRRRRRTAS